MTVQQYCLRWNNHQPNFISVFSSLLSSQSLVDVTLAAEGKHLQAHKVVLSACSSYFQSLFTINPCKHPIVILKDVTFTDLKVMVDFMYHGEVNVSQEQLPCILKTAEMLKIKGLTEIPVDQSASRCESRPPDKHEMSSLEENWSLEETPRITSPGSPTSKRKRLKKNIICSSGTDPETSSNELLLSSVDNVNIIGTVLKTESDRYTTENTQSNTTPQKCNGIPIPSIHPGPSHELSEPDPSHHISLQVTQHDLNVPHTVDCSTVEMPRATSVQQATAGMQWNVLDQSGYAHYSSTSAVMSNNVGTQFTHNPEPNHSPPSPNNNMLVNPSPNQSTESYTQVHKRKRSINPQGDENFIRALEAVRFGGIGFCKAARMYGVNNRTLWLEYKKRGYPNFRLSIKNRHQNQAQAQGLSINKDTSQNCQEQVEVSLHDRQLDNKMVPCTLSHPIVISGTVYDGNKVDLKHVLQRNKYYENTENQAQTINFQSIQLEQM